MFGVHVFLLCFCLNVGSGGERDVGLFHGTHLSLRDQDWSLSQKVAVQTTPVDRDESLRLGLLGFGDTRVLWLGRGRGSRRQSLLRLDTTRE